MNDKRRAAILREVLKWDGIPLREDDDFTLNEYCDEHQREFGYRLPTSTARDRLDARVRQGELKTEFRYDPEKGERRVWWKPNESGGEK